MKNYFKKLFQLNNEFSDPLLFWNSVLDYPKKKSTSPNLQTIAQQNLIAESKIIANCINSKLKKQNIPSEVSTLYFGLFEQTDKNSNCLQGFYISGLKKPFEKSGDFLCDLFWKPKWRYFKVNLLSCILKASKGGDLHNNSRVAAKATEDILLCWNDCGEICKITKNNEKVKLTQEEQDFWMNLEIDEPRDEDDLYSYFLTFGAAIAIVKSVINLVDFENRRIFVGFDSGDFIEVNGGVVHRGVNR